VGVAEGLVMAPRVAREGGCRWCGCLLSGGANGGAVCAMVMDRSGGRFRLLLLLSSRWLG